MSDALWYSLNLNNPLNVYRIHTLHRIHSTRVQSIVPIATFMSNLWILIIKNSVQSVPKFAVVKQQIRLTFLWKIHHMHHHVSCWSWARKGAFLTHKFKGVHVKSQLYNLENLLFLHEFLWRMNVLWNNIYLTSHPLPFCIWEYAVLWILCYEFLDIFMIFLCLPWLWLCPFVGHSCFSD